MRSNKKSIKFSSKDAKKILHVNSPFAIKEAYNTARTNLMFSNRGEKCPIYVFSSALPNDGKSINCINVAISFALIGKRTLIIDMDMRNSTIHKLFGLQQNHGISEILAGFEQKVIFQPTDIRNLAVLPAGKTPPNPAELLSGDGLKDLLTRAKETFDYIFIDTPPVEIVADASIIAKHATGVILVVKSGVTDKFLLKHSVDLLKQVDANVVGFILNDFNLKSQSYRSYNKYGYKYYKEYGYAEDQQKLSK